MQKAIPYGRQEITSEDIQAVSDCLKSDFLTQGPTVEAFEKAFAELVGAPYAVAVNNATAALHLCNLALQTKAGQKVLCTPNTFVASSNSVLYCGADVEFIDIDPTHFCLDINLLEKKLSQAPKGTYAGVIAVDFAGYPIDFENLSNLTKKHGLWLIEDACHAPGAEFMDSKNQWQKSGSGQFSDFATFSFHPVKHIATGEGGMIVTADKSLYEKVKLLRTHGITKNAAEFENSSDGGWYHEMQALGFNYRMPDILAALGLSQTKRFSQNLEKRRAIAQRYQDGLTGIKGLQTPEENAKNRHAYHLYVIQTEKRKELYEFLKSKNIFCQVHYIPIYRQPFYESKYGKMSLKQTDTYYNKALSLPMYHALTVDDQNYVIAQIREFFA
jgi:UDP-4-amino-4,6-dideoxy-N-acetyl-beta-L-altrosamine transaminase